AGFAAASAKKSAQPRPSTSTIWTYSPAATRSPAPVPAGMRSSPPTLSVSAPAGWPTMPSCALGSGSRAGRALVGERQVLRAPRRDKERREQRQGGDAEAHEEHGMERIGEALAERAQHGRRERTPEGRLDQGVRVRDQRLELGASGALEPSQDGAELPAEFGGQHGAH